MKSAPVLPYPVLCSLLAIFLAVIRLVRSVHKKEKNVTDRNPTRPTDKIGVQMIEVKPDDAEQRLDRWLRRVFSPAHPRAD